MSTWTSSAPLRADIAGGTLDLWPLYLLQRGASTLNVALSLRARVEYVPGDDRWHLRAGDQGAQRRLSGARLRREARAVSSGDPFALVLTVLEHAGLTRPGRLTTVVEGPPGGGIGGSSALLIALYGLAARVTGRRLDRARLPQLARDLEARILQFPTGIQDYCPAIHGGVLRLVYEPGRTTIERLAVDVVELESRLVLAYSGKPHSSGPSNWNLYRRRIEGDPAARAAFESIGRAANRAVRALQASKWRALGAAMDADWEARKRLDARLATPELRRVEAAARAAGVAGAKCCGAAAGGCMLVLLRQPGDRAEVTLALEEAGAGVLPATIARSGLRVRRRERRE